MSRLLVLLCLPLLCAAGESGSPLHEAMTSLKKGLLFMQRSQRDINLDGVLGTRLVESQLSALLLYGRISSETRPEIEEMREIARTVSDVAMQHVRTNDPDYSNSIGAIMESPKSDLWYQELRTTAPGQPRPCAQAQFDEDDSDRCIGMLLGQGDVDGDCRVTDECRRKATLPGQRGYALTHQVLFWQILEMRGCVDEVKGRLRVGLCSDVLRDARTAVAARFPLDHRDLFAEQVGLCGMWGFYEFARVEWIRQIISWQKPSGCFDVRRKYKCRDKLEPDHAVTKRREKMLADGCLSHKTAVSIFALATSLRYLLDESANATMQHF